MKKFYLLLIGAMSLVSMQAQEQDNTQVYLMGDATPTGWNAKGLPMTKSGDAESAIFEWTGNLKSGSFKFSNVAEGWQPAFNATASDTKVVLGTDYDVVYHTSDTGSDHKFILSDEGAYTVSIDLKGMKMNVRKADNYDLSQIYLVGDATTAGWNENEGVELTKVEGTVATFEWTGNLSVGKFRFKNQKEGWWPGFNPAVSEGDLTVESEKTYSLTYNAAAPKNDYAFQTASAGEYKVTVDLEKLTMTISQLSVTPLDYWLVGSALPEGSVKLAPVSAEKPLEFFYAGALQEGELKISTSPEAGEGVEYYIPTEEDIDILDASALSATKDAAAKGWNVTVSDPYYKIKIDMVNKTISAVKFASRSGLYLVGGATSVGWDAGSAIPFVQNAENPNVFELQTELKVGTDETTSVEDNHSFKILGQQGWGYQLNAVADWESALTATTFTDSGANDYKWVIDDEHQGNWKITVDLFKETFKAEFLGGGAGVDSAASDKDVTVYAVGGTVYVDAAAGILNARIFNLAGVEVASAGNGSASVATGLAKGVYIATVATADGMVSKKFAVR